MDWDQLVAQSADNFNAFLRRHAGSVGLERMEAAGFLQYFRDMVEDNQPFDFDVETMDAEVARYSPIITVPVPEFVAHLFEHWDEWRREEGRGVLLVLPTKPNFTHGSEWWRRDPNDGRKILERAAPTRWTLTDVPRPKWELMALHNGQQGYGGEDAAHNWDMSHGFFSDPRLGYYRYGLDNVEVEINGELCPDFSRLEGMDGYPWNCWNHEVALQRLTIRMRCKGIYTCASDQYPEDGEWSKPIRIGRAYRWDQVPSVFNTIHPDAAHGRNFSARLAHRTMIIPDVFVGE